MEKVLKNEADHIRAKIEARKKAAEAASQNAAVNSSLKKKAKRRPKKLSSGSTLEAATASSPIEQDHAPSQKVTIDTAVVEAAVKLKDAELAVVENYLADPARNQTAAYLKAHPESSREAACVSAHRLLRRAKVSAYLDARRRQIAECLDVTPERVLGEIAKIAFANAKDYFTWGPDGVRLRDHSELEAELAAAVAEVSETTTAQGGTLGPIC
jgi:hypothetical protein